MTPLVKLKKFSHWYILKEDFGDAPLSALRLFITEDLEWNAERFKNLKDQPLVEFCGDISFVTKEGENITIELDYVFNDQPYIFATTYENFVRIINDWEAITKNKPDYVTIYRNGDKVWFSTEE